MTNYFLNELGGVKDLQGSYEVHTGTEGRTKNMTAKDGGAFTLFLLSFSPC